MNLSQQDWKKQLATDENAIVLDVRTAEECLDGIIFNALNIDIYKGQEFIHKIDELDNQKIIMFIVKPEVGVIKPVKL